MCNYHIDLRYDLCLTKVSQGLGKNTTGEYVTKKFGQELCGMALNGEKNEDVCVLCKYLSKGELSRKEF